jgi:hypothetical protein
MISPQGEAVGRALSSLICRWCLAVTAPYVSIDSMGPRPAPAERSDVDDRPDRQREQEMKPGLGSVQSCVGLIVLEDRNAGLFVAWQTGRALDRVRLIAVPE